MGAVVSVAVVLSVDVVVLSVDVVVLSEELLAQESIRLKANAKIVGKKRNFSFFIEPQHSLDT